MADQKQQRPEDSLMPKNSEIHLGGAFTHLNALERKQVLLAALENVDTLSIQLWGIVEMDLVGVMTLIEVHRRASDAGKQIHLLNKSVEVTVAFAHFRETLEEVKAGHW